MSSPFATLAALGLTPQPLATGAPVRRLSPPRPAILPRRGPTAADALERPTAGGPGYDAAKAEPAVWLWGRVA